MFVSWQTVSQWHYDKKRFLLVSNCMYNFWEFCHIVLAQFSPSLKQIFPLKHKSGTLDYTASRPFPCNTPNSRYWPAGSAGRVKNIKHLIRVKMILAVMKQLKQLQRKPMTSTILVQCWCNALPTELWSLIGSWLRMSSIYTHYIKLFTSITNARFKRCATATPNSIKFGLTLVQQ